MLVDVVKLSADTFRGLVRHSFVTEHEEVLGMVYGNFDNREIRIWGCVNLVRNCKEKDRVEVDELQLSDAMHKAEELSESLGEPSFLVGWFHSHPNITVFPSHVDLNTQLSLQSLGGHFIGLIISNFSRDNTNLEKINLIAFQTIPGSTQGISIPIVITNTMEILKFPNNLQRFDSYEYLLQAQKNLIEEDKKKLTESLKYPNHLTQIFNSSLFNISITRILQKTLKPMVFFLRQQILADQKNLNSILAENNQLLEILK